jgi:starch phosphorylase
VADFGDYLKAQSAASQAYRDREKWAKMSILNTACSGRFSTDRTINEYNNDIWKLRPTPSLSAK